MIYANDGDRLIANLAMMLARILVIRVVKCFGITPIDPIKLRPHYLSRSSGFIGQRNSFLAIKA
jgi:hypothetical protein